MKTGFSIRLFFAATTVFVLGVNPALCATLFFDNFNGPHLSKSWQAAPVYSSSTSTFQVPTKPTFGSISGNTVAFFENTMNNHTYTGYVTANTFTPKKSFSLDVRFNTMVQSSSTSIDVPLQVVIVDSSNTNNYVSLDIGTQNYGDPSEEYVDLIANNVPTSYAGLTVGSSPQCAGIGGSYYYFQNNTFYHFTLYVSTTGTAVAALARDDGTTIVSTGLGFALGSFPNGFKIGLAQASGTPNQPAPHAIAVDYVKITGS